MVAMRGLIIMGIEDIQEYEDQLFSSFSYKNKPFENLKENLANSYYELRQSKDSKGKKIFDERNPWSNDFQDLFRFFTDLRRSHADRAKVKERSETFLYQHFWHSLFPVSTKLNQKQVGAITFIIKFDISNKPAPRSFPYRLAQLIHKKSF